MCFKTLILIFKSTRTLICNTSLYQLTSLPQLELTQLIAMVMYWVCLVGALLLVSETGASEPLLKTGERKISFRAPQLTEEESESFFVPSDFNCDVCKVIAYQVNFIVKTSA